MNTMLVVIMVSRRVGQVTLATSALTSRTNSIGFFVVMIAILQIMAGAEGLEPTTLGFGDRCSTN